MSRNGNLRPLNVIIGVNGIGMGHTVRQSVIAQFLRDRGHRVRIVTNGASRAEYFRDLGFPAWDGWMPTLLARDDRIHARDAVRANIRQAPGGLLRHLHLRRAVRNSGVPDVFVTDYEPNTPRLAYHFGRPLISIDQQSKYRHLDLPAVGRYARTADEQRLRYFAPRVDRSFICSFVPLAADDRRVEFISPVVPDLVRSAPVTTERLVTAYFSRYFDHGPEKSVRELASVFRQSVPDRTLRIYAQPTEMGSLRGYADSRVEIRAFDREAFIADMARSEVVFSNAGFNLISEALVLGKPVHLIPLPTYDQHWCAKVVDEAGLGTAAPRVERRAVVDFLARSQALRDNVVRHRDKYLSADPREGIASYLESLPAVGRPMPAPIAG
ncbi:UDP-glucuronosyltransferase-like protein [Streptomyces spongiicola]|uniref:UDP-glucuronosyltransferase-like protein n=1 Tax=Streptomyces spongiicola TaxID=1690221 RepID=A0ABM6V2G2_9ACTN|nr:glycosyltransferase family protein [Streptomyces spongiicola]AWK08293.1 UDP-glucuronosyltransferase-like protein [Streptomyces spongiicola]